jgi:hypothetical protein
VGAQHANNQEIQAQNPHGSQALDESDSQKRPCHLGVKTSPKENLEKQATGVDCQVDKSRALADVFSMDNLRRTA